MAEGRFQEVLDDPNVKKGDVDTIAFCSGKIYYDILEEREKKESGENIAVVRLEQLYPFPEKQIDKILAKYKSAKNYIWIQEEPENMGAWGYILRTFRKLDLELISRKASGSPAAGSSLVHEKRHRALLDKLFSYAKEKVS
jgi:2-oxoglutarate dehydrogenase E1 component